jgi:hypothetical protein
MVINFQEKAEQRLKEIHSFYICTYHIFKTMRRTLFIR